MFIAFNIILIALVLLIAYWWANQGVFSALLHLVAVVAAGAVALAFWEPLVVGFLLRGKGFDNYAWGVTLIGLFVAALLVLRVALDKLVPANVDMPPWANLVFGFPLGLGAGVLTMGIFVTGIGFIQSHREILGWEGPGRDQNTAQVGDGERNLWFPVHKLTYDFYSRLSTGALSTQRPLRHYQPQLDRQASLVRDSFNKGRAAIALGPKDAKVDKLLQCTDESRYIVGMKFESGARDFGEQLTLSSSQIRLIGRGKGRAEAPVAHPDRWRQDTGYYLFDDLSHYVSSVAGRQEATVLLEFEVPADFDPRFIQVRNTRFALPAAEPIVCASLRPAQVAVASGGGDGEVMLGGSIQTVIQVSNSIRPVQASTNLMPPGFDLVGKFLAEGEGKFLVGRQGFARNLMIEGIYEPKGTRIVQLNVSRGGPADIFGPIRDQIGRRDELALVDSNGNRYPPMGYMHTRADGVVIRLEPRNFLRTARELPQLPTSGTQELKLLFRVTTGVTIVSFEWGELPIGACALVVTEED
jgi:hypothetical protein